MESCIISTEMPDLVDIVRRWGGSTADGVLDPLCRIFQTPEIEGVIGFRLAHGCAIVFGDPMSAPGNKMTLARAFQRYCQEQNWNVIYIIASEEFTRQYMAEGKAASVKFGEELYLDPHKDPMKNTGENGCLVRRKVRRAIREGLTFHEYSNNRDLEQGIKQVASSWLQGRDGPQIHISHANVFENRMGKRWFYAERDGNLMGVVVLNELKSKQGWLLNHLMPRPEAPHGTSELLVVSALNKLAEENCHYVTFGAVPADALHEVEGLGQFSSWLAKLSYKMARRIFHLDGPGTFWGKFLPQSKPCYVIFSSGHVTIKGVMALMRALNVTLT